MTNVEHVQGHEERRLFWIKIFQISFLKTAQLSFQKHTPRSENTLLMTISHL